MPRLCRYFDTSQERREQRKQSRGDARKRNTMTITFKDLDKTENAASSPRGQKTKDNERPEAMVFEERSKKDLWNNLTKKIVTKDKHRMDILVDKVK